MQPAPVATADRIETLDVLRGFALLGILAMNIRAMAAPFGAYMYPYALFDYTGLNREAYIFTSTVFDLKMMGLFSMLFGAGAILYAAKSTETGKAAARALVQTNVLAAGDRPGARVPDLGRRHPRAVRALRDPPPLVGAPAPRLGPGGWRRRTSSPSARFCRSAMGMWEGMSEAERAQEAEIGCPRATRRASSSLTCSEAIPRSSHTAPRSCSWARRSTSCSSFSGAAAA